MNAPNLQYPMKQATSATFYPFDASTWQSEAHQTSLASPQATFSGTVWDVPSLELDSAVNMMPVLSYESSFEDSQTSLNASYPLEAGWIGSPAPFDGSRAQSEECEENARKEKRRHQNRRAQQAYRMRREEQIASMEKELRVLREAHQQLKEEHETLLSQLTAVKIAVA